MISICDLFFSRKWSYSHTETIPSWFRIKTSYRWWTVNKRRTRCKSSDFHALCVDYVLFYFFAIDRYSTNQLISLLFLSSIYLTLIRTFVHWALCLFVCVACPTRVFISKIHIFSYRSKYIRIYFYSLFKHQKEKNEIIPVQFLLRLNKRKNFILTFVLICMANSVCV